MIDRVKTLTVADAIVEKLLGYISSGKLAWGEQLPSQRELAMMLDVGVSSAREALQVLQAMGFIEVRRGDGTYVVEKPSVPLTKSLLQTIYQDDDVGDLMELREVLDTGLAVLAAKKATDEDIAEMDKCLAELEENFEIHPDRAAGSDLKFHIALAESVRNPLLTQFSAAVRESYALTAVAGAGVRLIRGRPGLIHPLPDGDGMAVQYEDTLTQKREIRRFDMVVLSGNLRPSLGTGYPAAVEADREACGFAAEPADVAQAAWQGSAAALRGLTEKGEGPWPA